MKKTYEIEHQDQASHDVRSSSEDLFLRNLCLQPIPKKYKRNDIYNETQVNSPIAGTLDRLKKTLDYLNQVCNYPQEPQENQLLSIQKHLDHLAITRGIENERIPNLRTFTFNHLEPLTQGPNIGSNTSFIIQKPTYEANQHRKVLLKQETPGQSSKVECATSEPTAHSKMTIASHASISCINSVEDQNSIVEDMVVDQSTEVSCIKQNVLSEARTEMKSSANPKTSKEANHSGQTVENSMEEGSSMVEVVTSSEVVSTQDIDNDKQSNSSKLKSNETITTSPTSKEQLNKSAISIINKADIWVDKFNDLFQKMKINHSETCQIAHELHESLVKSQKVIECIANKVENFRALNKGKVAVVSSKEVTPEVQQIAEQNQAERKEEETPIVSMEEEKKKDNDVNSKTSENDDGFARDINNIKDQDNQASKTTRGHIRTFVLPPEYDPRDTRWTLKYRKYDPKLNLVELVPKSKVFVNSLKLAHCKLTAKDSKGLARMLLVEVFSKSALSVCSLTGVRANAFHRSGTNIRPGLDKKARIVLLSFVKEHALEKNWIQKNYMFDAQSVLHSLRSKIQEMRAKYGKTA